MSVYVDGVFEAIPQGDTPDARQARRLGNKWSHMTADTLEELHAMADKIGMRRNWYQPAARLHFCHYDLVPSRRARAVALGAVEVDSMSHMRQLLDDGRMDLMADGSVRA